MPLYALLFQIQSFLVQALKGYFYLNLWDVINFILPITLFWTCPQALACVHHFGGSWFRGMPLCRLDFSVMIFNTNCAVFHYVWKLQLVPRTPIRNNEMYTPLWSWTDKFFHLLVSSRLVGIRTGQYFYDITADNEFGNKAIVLNLGTNLVNISSFKYRLPLPWSRWLFTPKILTNCTSLFTM